MKCKFPKLSPYTGYSKGCRCVRCKEAGRQSRLRFKSSHPGWPSKYANNWYRRNAAEWKNWFIATYGSKVKCGICGKSLHWGDKDKRSTACFDHRSYQSIIKKCPLSWCRSNACSIVNQKIFISCNFGILCNRCNALLGKGISRNQFCKNLIKYIKGEKNDE